MRAIQDPHNSKLTYLVPDREPDHHNPARERMLEKRRQRVYHPLAAALLGIGLVSGANFALDAFADKANADTGSQQYDEPECTTKKIQAGGTVIQAALAARDDLGLSRESKQLQATLTYAAQAGQSLYGQPVQPGQGVKICVTGPLNAEVTVLDLGHKVN